MENIISGSDALGIIGISHKKGPAAKLLKPYGLQPVYSTPFGKGSMTFYDRDKVVAVAAREAEKRTSSNVRDFVKAGEKTRFMPTVEAMEVMRRLEAKVDRLLMMWGDKHDS